MLTYDEMNYFLTFVQLGTLSGVAKKFCISQPTITRAMKKAESEYGVVLFDRTKNSIKPNENGIFAAGEISKIIRQTDEAIKNIRTFDRSNRMISIGSGAAVQIPELMRIVTEEYPEKPIWTELKTPSELIEGLENSTYQMIVLPFKPENADYCSMKIGEEHLMFLLPTNHRLAAKKALSLSDMNGETMLLFSDIGFWADIVKTKMPLSKFLIQNEMGSFEALIENSVLPCFTSDLVMNKAQGCPRRVAISIEDKEVNVTYYLVCKKANRNSFIRIFNDNNKKQQGGL